MTNTDRPKPMRRRLAAPLAVLCALCALTAAFHLLKGNKAVMTAWADRVSKPLCGALAGALSFTDWSAAEWVVAAAAVFAAGYVVFAAVSIITSKGSRLATAAVRLLVLLDVCLAAYFVMCANWGVRYYAESFSERSGILPVQPSAAELAEVTRYFADMVNSSAGGVERDGSGVYELDLEGVLGASPALFEGIAQRFPFLDGPALRVKKARLSTAMSAITTTGYFFPYTGEATVNIDAPGCFIPATVAHEISHQRGVASEQEASFAAVLVCTESGIADYEYSGWLSGYVELHNALFKADRELCAEIYGGLCPEARADLAANSAYWAKYESGVSEASDKAYDSFLKGYDQELGRRSYGAVVDLLVAYYGGRTADS